MLEEDQQLLRDKGLIQLHGKLQECCPRVQGDRDEAESLCFTKSCLLPRTNSAAFRQNMHLLLSHQSKTYFKLGKNNL